MADLSYVNINHPSSHRHQPDAQARADVPRTRQRAPHASKRPAPAACANAPTPTRDNATTPATHNVRTRPRATTRQRAPHAPHAPVRALRRATTRPQPTNVRTCPARAPCANAATRPQPTSTHPASTRANAPPTRRHAMRQGTDTPTPHANAPTPMHPSATCSRANAPNALRLRANAHVLQLFAYRKRIQNFGYSALQIVREFVFRVHTGPLIFTCSARRFGLSF